MKLGAKVTVQALTASDPEVIIIRPRVIVREVTPNGVFVEVPLTLDHRTGQPQRYGPFPKDRLAAGWIEPRPIYTTRPGPWPVTR